MKSRRNEEKEKEKQGKDSPAAVIGLGGEIKKCLLGLSSRIVKPGAREVYRRWYTTPQLSLSKHPIDKTRFWSPEPRESECCVIFFLFFYRSNVARSVSVCVCFRVRVRERGFCGFCGEQEKSQSKNKWWGGCKQQQQQQCAANVKRRGFDSSKLPLFRNELPEGVDELGLSVGTGGLWPTIPSRTVCQRHSRSKRSPVVEEEDRE